MRRAIVISLIILGIILGVLGTTMVYVWDAVVDSDEAAQRAVNALSQPEIRELIAERVVDQIVVVAPDALAVRPLLKQVVMGVLAAPSFQSVLQRALRDLHQTIFIGNTNTLTVELTDMVLVVKTQVSALSPELGAQIPDEITDTLIDIQSDPLLLEVVRAGEVIRVLALALPLLTLAAFAGAILLAADRRRTLVWVGFGVIGAGLFILIAEEAGRLLVAGLFESETAALVARVSWDAFAADLGFWGLIVAGAGAVLVAALWWMSEPIDLVARLGRASRFLQPPAATLPRLGWVMACTIVGALLVLAWQEALRVMVTLAGVVFLVNALGELLRLIAPRSLTPDSLTPAPGREAGSGGGRKILLLGGGLAVAAAIIVGGFFAIQRSGGGDILAQPANPACNGHILLCDRPFDDVVIAATHNSMSSAADEFLLANHARGIIPQLESGYRGLLIDVHYGIQSERAPVVVTDISALTPEKREQLVQDLGEAAVRSAEELRQRNDNAGGVRELYLCHRLCEIGASRFAVALEGIRTWMDDNPREVLVIIIEDHAAPDDVADAFVKAGLLPYTHTQYPGVPWPTLREMIDSGRRLVVLAENDTGGVPWYHDAYTYTQETPYSFETVEQFNCAANRGRPDSPLFMINHWVTPAFAGTGAVANSAETLNRRVAECLETRGLTPNIIGVDFYGIGDAVAVAGALNGLPPPEDQ